MTPPKPPPRPERVSDPRTATTVRPAVLTERESERPSAPIFSDSQRPVVEKVERLRGALRTLEPDDRELFVQTIYAMLESLNTRADKRDMKNKAEIEELESKLNDKDQEIERLQRIVRQSLQDDEERDAMARRFQHRLTALEEERIVVRAANRVEDKVGATGAAGAATVINAARHREFWLEVAKWVAIVIVYVLTLLGVRMPTQTKTDVSVPNTHPRPAGTGFAGSP